MSIAFIGPIALVALMVGPPEPAALTLLSLIIISATSKGNFVKGLIMCSTGIGIALGVIPGVGQVVADFVGYGAAKNASKHPERFGQGELEGVAAPEAANNAVNGPTLVPLLTLGIPGDKVTAILLGAFVAQGLRPGTMFLNPKRPWKTLKWSAPPI